MGKPKAPAPPDPVKTAAAQTGANVTTAVANAWMGNINENTPDGSTSFNQTGTQRVFDSNNNTWMEVPTFTRTTTLSPAQQAIAEQNNRANLSLATTAANQAGFLQNYLSRPVDQSNQGPAPVLPTLRTSYDTEFTADRARTEEALFSRLNPQIERDREALASRLANQGIRAGSAAYDREMGLLGQNINDARMQAVLASGQEQSRLADLARQSADFSNQANIDQYNAATAGRAQAMQEQFAFRNQPINEITALLSGTQVQQPQFMGANIARIPTTDHAGIIQQDFQNRLGLWQQNAQQQQNLMGGLLGFGGRLLSLSDERAKENIKKVGKLDGHNLYRYNYKGDPTRTKHVGVMAQEVEKKRPDAVLRREDGMRVVNYGGLFGKKES